MVTIGPSQRDGTSAVAIGAVIMLFSLWLAAVLLTNRLIVTPASVVLCNYLRRRTVGWAEVLSFGVDESRTVMRYPALVIRRIDGSLLVTNIVSFTMTYPARIADELTSLQRQLAPARPDGS
jgi:hypothetical protein